MNWDVATETPKGRVTVPVQWEDPPERVRGFGEGDRVVVVGIVRRRFFHARGQTGARTEVLGAEVAKPTQRATAARLFGRVCEELLPS